MATNDQVPGWVVAMFVLVGLFGFGALVYIVREARSYPQVARKRLYPVAPERVSAAAVKVIEKLKYGIWYMDEQTISFSHRVFVSKGAPMVPVVHLVILPAADGRSQVEAIGARGRRDYAWDVTAQSFLKELDQALLST